MRQIAHAVNDFFKKADILLLLLCIAATVFGIVVISSATNTDGNLRFILVQTVALILGIIGYIILTLIDVDIIAERRELLLIFCVIFIGLLKPFGISGTTGNKSWLDIPLIPFNLQPAEICKIFYIVILAKMMSISQKHLSSPFTIAKIGGMTVFLFLFIIYVSSDTGVALIYLFIFMVMAFVGGVNLLWFLVGFGVVGAAAPILWTRMRQDQQDRILMLFDSSIDPLGRDVRYDTNLSLRAITNGGMTGQGLFHGNMTQSHSINAQHTDFVFSTIAEELGMIGALFALLLLLAIILRCIHVGVKSGNYLNRTICVGVASMLTFQIIINVGMCLGVLPVIGLTLPFISYGGSSVVTMFMAMGVVSGIHMRPAPDSNARYIRPRIE